MPGDHLLLESPEIGQNHLSIWAVSSNASPQTRPDSRFVINVPI